jgi:tungstate transport system permease protein
MDFIQEGFAQAVTLLVNRDPATYSAISATLRASSLAMAVSLILGIPLGYLLGYFDFFLKKQFRIIVDTLLSLPTVFIGLVIYALLTRLLTRNGPLGETGLLFTIPGIAIGQAILSLPIIIALTATAVETADRNLRITLMSLGANGRQIAATTLWEVRLGILAAAVTATGRVLTEVGISLMVGGNIKWNTRTITTAIALETSKGEFGMGIALGVVLLLIALTVNISLAGLRRRI